MTRDQPKDAQDLYDNRSTSYDDSFHPRFARHMVELIKPQPGEHVLDLACGTGLVSFPAGAAVGASGSVTGVDVSTGMLAQAERMKAEHDIENVTFHQHSMTDLNSLDAAKNKQFDIVTCCSAFVLLEQPAEALKHWTTFLKPGGRLIVDVTHPQNLTTGVIFERVGDILGKPLPWYRLNFQEPEDLQRMMAAAGLNQVSITFMSQQASDSGSEKLEDFIRSSFDDPKIFQEYDVEDAGRIFDENIAKPPMKRLARSDDVKARAKEVFAEEWRKIANENGKVLEIDGIWMGIGWKPV